MPESAGSALKISRLKRRMENRLRSPPPWGTLSGSSRRLPWWSVRALVSLEPLKCFRKNQTTDWIWKHTGNWIIKRYLLLADNVNVNWSISESSETFSHSIFLLFFGQAWYSCGLQLQRSFDLSSWYKEKKIGHFVLHCCQTSYINQILNHVMTFEDHILPLCLL